MARISIGDYAKKHNRPYSTVMYHINIGLFKTATKTGGGVYMDEDEPYPDAGMIHRKKARTCLDCGLIFPGGHNAKYCLICRAKRKEAVKKRDTTGTKRKLSDERICARCVRPFTIRGGKRRYCPDCAKERIVEYVKKLHDADKNSENGVNKGNKLSI